MPKQFKYVSANTVINKVIRDTGITDINKADMVEWVGEVLQGIGTNGVKEEHVMFLEIKDHVAELPAEVQEVVKVYRNNVYDQGDCITPLEIYLEDVDDTTTELVPLEPVRCGCETIADEDLPRWTRQFEKRWAHLDWSKSSIYKKGFTNMALSSAILFQGVVCESINQGVTSGCIDEYQLQSGVIKTSFATGQVAIAYRTIPVDEEGYPMIPDLYSVQSAIAHYITYRIFSRLWYQGREGMSDKMQWADREYQFYVKQAQHDTWALHGIDEHQNFMNQRKAPFGKPSFDNLGRPSTIYPKGRI